MQAVEFKPAKNTKMVTLPPVVGRIKLLLMDCDGVLTDGRLYFSAGGEELKVFHVRDGQGLMMWHRSGRLSGIISGRGSEPILRRRVDELGIHFLKSNSDDKCSDFRTIIEKARVAAEEVAFIGDDIGDVELMGMVGFPVAVADAAEPAKAAASYVTSLSGGNGAVRELIDLLLAQIEV